MLRLHAFALRHLADPDGQWLASAVWAYIDAGTPLDVSLGLTSPELPGWASPRRALRQDRRDDLLVQLYRRCYAGASARSAAEAIASDHARIRSRWPRIRPAVVSRDPDCALGWHILLLEERHEVPTASGVRSVLARSAFRLVWQDNPHVETRQPAGAASEHGIRTRP